VHQLNASPCNDGDVCTINDHCELGECIGAGDLPCNDGNSCTDDSCDSDAGCQFVPNQVDCDDQNLCTDDDKCKSGICVGGTSVSCDDGNLCTDDSCEPADGCIHNTNILPCDDGNLCTVGDVCLDGACAGPGQLNCDDGNLCTDDSCEPLLGCVHDNNADACNDGNPCTPNDVCTDGACLGTGALDCDDDNVCTDDSCDPGTGCLHAANNAGCDDENECTTGDVCQDGECSFTGLLDCDDGNSCTEDLCNPSQGCIHTDTVPCCGNGIKEAGEACDDGNTNNGDGCSADCKSELVKHFDGFDVFYNSHPVDIHNKQRAIEACKNHTGKNCSDGYGQCGQAHYVSYDTSCSCNGARLWYYGTDNGGFIWGGDMSGKTTIKCNKNGNSWY